MPLTAKHLLLVLVPRARRTMNVMMSMDVT